MEIKWNDSDPATGERRFLRAERFAGVWSFQWKRQRRDDWIDGLAPTCEMWLHLLDALQRRYRRREGVSDEDVAQVAGIIKKLPAPRTWEEEP